MPTYTYRCDCGEVFERIMKIKEYTPTAACSCGRVAERYLTPVRVMSDYAGYSCPVSGRWIEGRKAHNENLKRTGCRLLEPGEAEQARRNAQAQDEQLFDSIAETAAAEVAAMPQRKREQLEREMESGLNVAVVRQ